MRPAVPEPFARAGAAEPASIRRHNLSLVLQVLAERGPRSRASLALDTGLTKATVSKLVSDLIDRGIVREAETVQGRSGRPATLVTVSGDRVVALGLEVDVDAIAVAAVDLDGRARMARVLPLDNRSVTPTRAVNRLAELAQRTAADLHAQGCVITGATVGVPGLVSDGRVLVAPNLGWHDVDLAGRLARAIEARVAKAGTARTGPTGPIGPIGVDNEANLAAIAEARARRRGPDAVRTFIYVSAGIGVGAGVVVDGELFRGAHGFGGELGHFVIDPLGARCRCGNRGCLETVVGKEHLLRTARRAGTRPAATDDGTWLPRLVAAAAEGDEQVLAALREVGAALATGLAAAVSLFDPEAIVLGGFLTELTPWLAPAIEAHLASCVLGSRWVRCAVRPSRLGPLAPLVGAGLRSLQAVIADPLLIAPAG